MKAGARDERYSVEEQRQAVLNILAGKATIDQLARHLGVEASTIERWQADALSGLTEGLRRRSGKSRGARGRTPRLPRLQDLVPEALAERVCARLRKHAIKVVSALRHGAQIVWEPATADGSLGGSERDAHGESSEAHDPGASDDGFAASEPADRPALLDRDIADLARWAQTGEGEFEEALDLFVGVFSVVYERSKDDGAAAPPLQLDEINLKVADEIDVFMLAALSRLNLRMNQSIDVRGLAILAGMSYGRLRHAAGRGSLRSAGRGRVVAEDARRFLESRRVPA